MHKAVSGVLFYSGSSISCSMGTKPNFSYSGLPIAVASSEMAVTPRRCASSTNRVRMRVAMPCRRYCGAVYRFIR